jgi:hypothetical protein
LVNWWKVLLRPVGLPVFIVSLPFAFFLAPVTAVGAAFYAGAVFWAYQRERNKALPPGTVEAIHRLPYKRHRRAHLALEYTRDIERQIRALPPEVRTRLIIDETDIGAFAGAAIRLYEAEGKAAELAKAGVEGADETAKSAAAQAEEILGRLKNFQHGLLALSMTGVRTDLALAEKRNAEALAAADELRAALVSADEELQKTLALEGAGGFAALESADSNEALPPGIDESDIDGENV